MSRACSSGERDINTVLGFLLNAFALYFGVLLALLSIAVFENHNKAEDTVVGEAAASSSCIATCPVIPSRCAAIGRQLHQYVDEVIGPGWAIQARGEVNPKETVILGEFHRIVSEFQPANVGQGVRYGETLRALDGFVEARRLRISAGERSIPSIMWFIVLVGAAMNVAVIWMFDLRPSTHAIIGGTISMFVGLVIYMVAVLDRPFRARTGFSPHAIAAVHKAAKMGE